MARKPTLSPSRFSAYLACQVLYRWTYADPRGRWHLRAKSYYSFGTTLHHVLEKFHEAGGDWKPEKLSEVYDESWLEAGFSDAEEMAEAYGEGRQILERYVEQEAKRSVSSKTLFVERLLNLEYDRFRLVGRLDRVDEHEDGSLEIIDYKSGRHKVSSEDVAQDIAMSCYQLLLSRQFPGRPIRATIIALRSGVQASASLSADELAHFERDIELLGDEIVTSDDLYDREPVYKEMCSECDFLPLCKRHEGFAEALAAGQNQNGA